MFMCSMSCGLGVHNAPSAAGKPTNQARGVNGDRRLGRWNLKSGSALTHVEALLWIR